MTHKITKEQLQDAVIGCTSIRQILLNLGIAAQGGNHKLVKRKLTEYEIDVSHLLGGSQKGIPKQLRRDISDYITNGVRIGSHRLKLRLIREGILTHQCSSCGGVEWAGVPIPIELDHIDGNSDNNSIDNLRLLCPNCHALTPTYRGKNKVSARDGGRTRMTEVEGF